MPKAMGGAMRVVRVHRETSPCARTRAREKAYAAGTPSSNASTVVEVAVTVLFMSERTNLPSRRAM